MRQAQGAGGLPATHTAGPTDLIVAAVHGLVDLRAGGRLRNENGLISVADGITFRLATVAGPASPKGG